MAKQIRPEWMKLMKEAVGKYHEFGVVPERQVFTWNTSCKWYIRYLTEQDVPFQVIQKGAGVKEVVIETHKCTVCNGRGYIKED